MNANAQTRMLTFKVATCLNIFLVLTACGKDDETAAEREETATAPPPQHEQLVPRAESGDEPVSGECGKGGTDCPAGLECVTFRGGLQACGPEAVEAVVLVKDGTLGGACLGMSAADTYPGTSIVQLEMIGNDGKLKGRGRLVWEQAGFAVAAERGTPPDGTEFTGDACSGSYNIGCDGQAVFEIAGAGGEVQKLREGEMVVVQLRGRETCGEEVVDEVEGLICNDPAAAASGDLSSCTFKVRMVEARSDMYGPDRVGGTIQYIARKKTQ